VADYINHLVPVNDEIARFMGYANAKAVEDSWESSLVQYIVNGQIYAFPWEVNFFAWGINKRHFRDAGLNPYTDYPKTWDDVITVGRRLTQRRDGRIIRHAVNFPYARPPIWYLMEFQPIFFQLGGRMFNDAGTETLINTPQAVEAMRLIRRRFEEGVTDRGLSTTIDSINGWQNEEFSMGIMSVIGWMDNFERANATLRGELKLIPNPSFPGVTPVHGASTWAHAVSARGRHHDWAWKLIDHLTNDPSSALLDSGALIPRVGWAQTEGGRALRDSDLIAEVSRNTFPSGTLIHWDQIQLPFQRAMQRIMYEDADIQTELNRAKAEIDQAIRR
jgi:ABC-type glycerol-3-phosphate transport system substrate-binding protein